MNTTRVSFADNAERRYIITMLIIICLRGGDGFDRGPILISELDQKLVSKFEPWLSLEK